MSQETHAGAVARLPPAGAARGAREARRDRSTCDPRGEPRRGLGGGRVLDRAVAGASIPTARSASASTSSRPTAPARSCTMDEYYGWMFENTVPGPARGGGARGPDAARLHAQVRRVPGRGQRLQHARAAARADGARRRDRRSRRRTLVAKDGAAGRRRGRRRVRARASRRRRASSSSTRRRSSDWGWPEHAVPATSGATSTGASSTAREGEMVAAADLPAADADPHALAATQVAVRDLALQPALDRTRATRARLGIDDRRPGQGRDADRLLRRPRRGSPRASGPASRPARTTWAAGGCTEADRRRALVAPRWSTLDGPRRRPAGACARCTARSRSRATIPTAQRIWWSDARRAPEPDLPGAARTRSAACTAGTRR